MTPNIMTDLLAYNCNLNTPGLAAPDLASSFSRSFMHELAREGDLLSAEVLVEAGYALDLPNDEGRRPLHEAAFFGHLPMVRFFVENGALVDAPIQPLGLTALYLAVQQSRYDVVTYLLRCGASFDVEDMLMGTGLLHVAAAKDDMQMAGMLVSAGINAFHEDKKGLTARDTAAKCGHRTLANALLKVMEHHAKFALKG